MRKLYYKGLILVIAMCMGSYNTGKGKNIYTKNYNTLQEQYSKENRYKQLNIYLEKYEHIAKSGGWNKVKKGRTLAVGMQNKRIALLKERLRISGDYISAGSRGINIFDEELKYAVMRFQERYGLDTTGKVDNKTLDALNVPVEERIKTIKINLKRISSLPKELGNYYILVNIPNYELQVIKNDSIISKHKVIVGKPDRKTPTYNATMEFLVFNPNWTIPPGILEHDIIPIIRKNPGYLKWKKITVYDKNGNQLIADSIHWESDVVYSYKYIQEPGKNNAFGDIKFVSPNPYNHYLHDTPQKRLFNKKERAFSSGCVRVDKPLELAELLLNNSHKWSMNDIQRLNQSDIRTRVDLKTKPKLYIVYWTSWVDEEGILNFRKDIYDKDE